MSDFLKTPEAVRRLELLAERGFSRSALAELTALSDDKTTPTLMRGAAALALFRLHYAGGRFAAAWHAMELCDRLNGPGSFKGQDEGAALCLSRQGRHDEALERLAPLSDGLDPAGPSAHLLMLKGTLRRKKMLADGCSVTEAEEFQLAAVNTILSAGGLEPITLRDFDKPMSLDNIHAPSAAACKGPLAKISVIMPAYNAGSTIATGIRGLMAQTWTNLEILVVDDFSADNTAQVVEGLAREDGRVKLFRQKSNQGAYRARNRGAAEAEGEFITVCDSDDWPHPRRIEILARHLMSRPSLATVRGKWCRCGQHLENDVAWQPSAAFVSDPSSHIYRKAMFDKIGPWDGEVRISADSELIDRIYRCDGKNAIEEIDSPPLLAFSRDGAGSAQLTRSGPTHHKTMYHAAGARFHYFKSYRHWHLKQLASGQPLDIRQKSFSIPPAIRPERQFDTHYALVMAADLSRPNEEAAAILTAAAGRGDKTAVVNWPAYSEPLAAIICPEMYELCFGAGIDILCSADRCSADLLKFVPPLDLNSFLDAYPQVTARQAEIPAESGGTLELEDFFLPEAEARLKEVL